MVNIMQLIATSNEQCNVEQLYANQRETTLRTFYTVEYITMNVFDTL